MPMRKPYKNTFKLCLVKPTYRGFERSKPRTFSIRLDRTRACALQRLLKDMERTAPDGWRWILA